MRVAPAKRGITRDLLHAFPSNITRDDALIARDCRPSLLMLQGRSLTVALVDSSRLARAPEKTSDEKSPSSQPLPCARSLGGRTQWLLTHRLGAVML